MGVGEMFTHFDAKRGDILVLSKAHVAHYFLDVTSPSVKVYEELVQMLLERQDNQLMHDVLEDLIEVEKFVWLQTGSRFVDFSAELLLAMLHQIVFHAIHELPDVAHHLVRNFLL